MDALAQLVQLATSGGEEYIDPTNLIDAVLATREHARASANYQIADELRDAILGAGFAVHDGPNGLS